MQLELILWLSFCFCAEFAFALNKQALDYTLHLRDLPVDCGSPYTYSSQLFGDLQNAQS